MVKARHDFQTMDLFTWQPEVPQIPSYPAKAIQAATLSGRISKAVATTLIDTRERKTEPMEREVVAQAMSDYLDKEVSLNVLNAYASQGRSDHEISLIRAIALMRATGDVRLLTLAAKELGLAVVPERFENAVKEAILCEKIEEMQRERDHLRKGRR